MSIKINNSIVHFERAYIELCEYIDLPIQNNRDRAGIIKAFEFTFELAWKTFQKIAKEEGILAGGPKSSLRFAFQADLITNDKESLWLGMLNDRNLLSHTYQHEISLQILERIKNSYQHVFGDIISRLKKSYSFP